MPPLQLNITCGCPICPFHGTALSAHLSSYGSTFSFEMATDNIQEHKKETTSKEPIDLTVNEVKSPPENRKLMNGPKTTNCVENF